MKKEDRMYIACSIKTLDDLTDQLKSDGFMVSYIINQSKRTDLLSLLVAINIQGE
jgi:hypothetical protein